MKFLQKLGKALMLPVAVLPICGILMGIYSGSILSDLETSNISGQARHQRMFHGASECTCQVSSHV